MKVDTCRCCDTAIVAGTLTGLCPRCFQALRTDGRMTTTCAIHKTDIETKHDR